MKEKFDRIIYTDGSCLGNPGPGGYGAVIIDGDDRIELSGGFRKTTNNRMELLAAVVALKALDTDERLSVKLHSDSRLLVDAFNKGWIDNWQKKGWKKSNKEAVLNKDIWEELVREKTRYDVTFVWVKGHAGTPENERCDALAKEAAEKKGLPPDAEYEQVDAPSLFEEELTSQAVKTAVLFKEEWWLGGDNYIFRLKEKDSGDIFLEIAQKSSSGSGMITVDEPALWDFLDSLNEFLYKAEDMEDD